MEIKLTPIGIIHTPYSDDAPFTDYEIAEGEFWVELNEIYTDGLYLLDKLTYCYIIFHLHKPKKEPKMRIYPPRGNGKEVGLFATRSPHRINSIGLTVAKIKKIEENRIYTYGLDILDGSPLLDIKPYILDFDKKDDANMGWIEDSISPSGLPA